MKNMLLAVRLRQDELEGFKSHCKKLKRSHSEVVREMIAALLEGRLKIEPTKAQKELYK